MTRVLRYFANSLSDDQRKKVEHIAVDMDNRAGYWCLKGLSLVISLFSKLHTFAVVIESVWHQYLPCKEQNGKSI
jgi:hypothetical protein